MNICQNLKSGKYFIYVNEIDWSRIKAVTPLNQIKILERQLFTDEINGSEANFLRHGLISEEQLKVYKDYERFHRAQKQEFIVEKSFPREAPVSANKTQDINLSRRKANPAMKTIEIDGQVYAFLQKNAIPFEENTPNQVIRRLLGINKQPPINQTTENQNVPRSTREKEPRVDLGVLLEKGLLQEGQRLFFNYKGRVFSKNYEAKVWQGKLLYEGHSYTMSGLVKEILEKEDAGIPSQAYRGPEYWYTSKGGSIRELWAQHLTKGINDA